MEGWKEYTPQNMKTQHEREQETFEYTCYAAGTEASSVCVCVAIGKDKFLLS